jgi:GH35 family endo-1,4-beta-xylanase
MRFKNLLPQIRLLNTLNDCLFFNHYLKLLKMKKLLLKNNTFILLLFTFFFFAAGFAQPLRQIAASKGKFIGNIMGTGFINDNNLQGGNLNTIASTEFNVLSPENAMKMDAILRTRPANPFNVTANDLYKPELDRFLAYGGTGMRKRGHAMIWFSQAPGWLQTEAPNWTVQQIYDFSRTYITALATYTRGRVQEWDVLNEAIDDGGTSNYRNAWYSRVNTQANNSGQIGYLTYFGSLFSWARAADPGAKLFYNDYSIEQFGTNKNNFMRTMVKALKTSTAPITGVGFQSHFILDNNGMSDGFIGQVGQSIDDLGGAGLEVVLTELDLRRCNSSPGTDALQRSAYDRIIRMALSKGNCNSVVIWGLTDGNSWIPQFFPGCGNATLHNASYQKKEAYFGVQSGLLALGGGGGGGTTTAPVGKAITLRGNNVRFVSSENGAQTGITCNRTTVGSWERFTVVGAGNGKIALKGTNGRYVSSENGAQAMRCDRTTIGASEAFDWVAVNGTTVQLRGNNARYVSSENGVGSMTCNRTAPGAWENFNWAENGTPFASVSTATEELLITNEADAGFKVMAISGTAKMFRVTLPANVNTLSVMDISGRQVKKIPVNGKRIIDVNLNNAAGIYIIQAISATQSISKKIVVE